MSTVDDHLRALKKANDAGDVEAANFIRQKVVAAQEEADRVAYDPTIGMSGLEKVRANVGAGMADIGLGIQQLYGGATGEDARKKAERDTRLAKATTGGKALQIGGTAALAVPAMFVPGANTVAGAGLVGAGTGALMPTQSDNLIAGKAVNAGIGALTGAAAQKYIPALMSAGGKAIKKIPEALASRGLLPERIASPMLRKQAERIFAQNVDDPSVALSKIGQFRDVPGTQPTTSQILGDTKSLMIERQLRESGGEAGQALSGMRTASNQARYKYLTDELDKDPSKLWDAAKDFAMSSKGKMRVAKDGIDPSGTVIREVGRLRNSYDNSRAKATLQELQDRIKTAMAKQGNDQLDSLHQVRMYEIDDALDRLTSTDSKLARSLSKDFSQVKSLLDKRLNEGLKKAGQWDDFLTGYSERARAAGQAEAGQELLGSIDNLTPASTGEPALTSGRTLLRKAEGAVDDFGNPKFNPLSADAIAAVNRSLNVEMAPLAPNIRPMGSPTAANLNQPNVKALQALQPVIRGSAPAGSNPSAAGAITGAATMMGGPAGGAAAAVGGMGTQKVAGALNRRAEEAALITARHLFEMYRDPQTAVQALRGMVQSGQVPAQQAGRIAQILQALPGMTGAQAGAPLANRIMEPAQ